MKVPRYIYVHLDGFDIESFMAHLGQKCSTDWTISATLDRYTAVPDRNLFCSKCGKDNDAFGSRLSLYLKDSDTLCVQNIIAYEQNQSSCFRCNNILEGFFENVVQPASACLDLAAELTLEEVSLSDVVGAEVAALLNTFSKLANKATGSSHPCDRSSWFDFILAAHRNGRPLNLDLLIHTLEEQGWSPEAAQCLGAEFEFGIKLLGYSEGIKVVGGNSG